MANEIIPGMGFHHIGLKAADFQKSVAFYKALGLRKSSAGEKAKKKFYCWTWATAEESSFLPAGETSSVKTASGSILP